MSPRFCARLWPRWGKSISWSSSFPPPPPPRPSGQSSPLARSPWVAWWGGVGGVHFLQKSTHQRKTFLQLHWSCCRNARCGSSHIVWWREGVTRSGEAVHGSGEGVEYQCPRQPMLQSAPTKSRPRLFNWPVLPFYAGVALHRKPSPWGGGPKTHASAPNTGIRPQPTRSGPPWPAGSCCCAFFCVPCP